jgi:small subunit ribosomal protein S20
MANHVSALKRVAQTRRRTAINRQRKGVLRSSLRGFRELLNTNDAEKARPLLTSTLSRIDKAAKTGLIHKNTAARLKSRLTTRLNAVGAAKT